VGGFMAINIAIANQKGGMAKSTTAVTLGNGLAGKGKTVLLVDCDLHGFDGDNDGIGCESG